MRISFSAIAVSFTISVLAGGCDDGPSYSAEPGVEVCESVVSECGDICDPNPSEPADALEFQCSYPTKFDFWECGEEVVARANLQELANDANTSAIFAAEGVIVGYNPTCEAALINFPVFCYDCE